MRMSFDMNTVQVISLYSEPGVGGYGIDVPDALIARYYAVEREFIAVQAELERVARETIFSWGPDHEIF